MAEIGAGAGSGYPSAVDTGATQEQATDYVRLGWGRDVEAAIVAIQGALGANPAGSAWATVVLRFAAMLATNGGVPRGLLSARPSAATGGWYYSTDVEILEFSDGTNWRPFITG